MEHSFSITDSAAERIAFLAKQEEKPGAKLRIAVDGGGCSGFQYRYDFTWDQNDDEDLVITKGDATVLIDQTSLEFMQDSVLDYVVTLGAAAFEIKNPQATANCGCGNSFAV